MWILIVGGIIGALLVWGAIRAGLENRQRQRWKGQLSEVASPLIRDIHSHLTAWLQDRYPRVEFHFPSGHELHDRFEVEVERSLDLMFRQQRTRRRSRTPYPPPNSESSLRHMAERITRSVMEEVSDAAAISYKSYLTQQEEFADLPAVPRAWASEDFWTSEPDNRITKGGRDPSDWRVRRELVFRRDQGRCRNCGKAIELEKCHIHHIKRRSEGGTHSLGNLVALCRDCHTGMDGHTDMRAIRPYWISGAGTIHRKYCRHAKRAKPRWNSLPRLQAEGHRPCKVCKPYKAHYALLKEWEPRIRKELRAWVDEALVRHSKGGKDGSSTPS